MHGVCDVSITLSNRSSMVIRGLISQKSTELAEEVPIKEEREEELVALH